MLKIISRIIPTRLKNYLVKSFIKFKYDVKFSTNAIVNFYSEFEGKNFIGKGSEFIDSRIGLGSYIANYSRILNTKIGRFSAIGDNVRTCLGIHPTSELVSIHPSFFSLQKQAGFTFVEKQLLCEHKYVDIEKKYVVDIGNDVWIGNNVTILDGVKINDGAIVGAGSVVTKEIEPYSIVVGIPARIIKYRFNEEQINFLLKFKWWNNDFDWIKSNSNFYQSIELFMQLFNK